MRCILGHAGGLARRGIVSSKLWRYRSRADFIRPCQSSTMPTIAMLGELLCLASFVGFFAAPAQAAMGGAALGLRLQAALIAPVEKVQSTNGQKRYRWYTNGWNGPGYYQIGDAWNPGVGWGGGYGWAGAGGGSPIGGSRYSAGNGGFGNSPVSGSASSSPAGVTSGAPQASTVGGSRSSGQVEYEYRPGRLGGFGRNMTLSAGSNARTMTLSPGSTVRTMTLSPGSAVRTMTLFHPMLR